MTKPKPKVTKKYIVPDQVKSRVRDFMNTFLQEQNISKPKLAKLMHEKFGRSSCRTSMLDKFSRASFKLSEVMEIADLFGYELKFVPKDPNRGSEKGMQRE